MRILPNDNAEEFGAIHSSSLSISFTISEVRTLPVGGNIGSPLADRRMSGAGWGVVSALRISSLIALSRVIPLAFA